MKTREKRSRKRNDSGNSSQFPFPKILGAVKVKSPEGIVVINKLQARPFLLFFFQIIFRENARYSTRFPLGKDTRSNQEVGCHATFTFTEITRTCTGIEVRVYVHVYVFGHTRD